MNRWPLIFSQPEGLHGPMGQFTNARIYPNASFKDVTAPNADTLYSSAFLDPEGTLRPEHSRRTWTLLHDAHAERLDDSVPGTGHPHDRNQGAEVSDQRPGMNGRCSRWRDAVQV